MPKNLRVCPRPGCPELVGPEGVCALGHGRPNNATWTNGRDRSKQHHFRLAVLNRDNNTCRRCGHHDPTTKQLVAHHVQPGYDKNAGLTLCHNCHATIDKNARAT